MGCLGTTPINKLKAQHQSIWDSLKAKASTPVAGVKVPSKDRFRNKTERAYALHLDALMHMGTVRSYAYEALTFRLADGSRFTPDFLVVLPDDVMECHEVKGFLREAARVRYLVAKDKFPQFGWKMVGREHGQWVTRKL